MQVSSIGEKLLSYTVRIETAALTIRGIIIVVLLLMPAWADDSGEETSHSNQFYGELMIWILAFLLFLTTPVQAQPNEYYVSPAGNDNNAGTLDAPFLTLSKAQQAVRSVNSNMSTDLYVYLRGGTYYLPSVLALTEADSGTNGHNVIWMAYPGDGIPIISGGTAISGWISTGGGIYRASGVTGNFRQLYVNGARAIRARTPNLDTYNLILNYSLSDNTVLVNSSDVGAWQIPANVEIHTHLEWEQHDRPVIAVLPQGNGTTKIQAEPGLAQTFDAILNSASLCHCINVTHYWFENDYQMLDVQGEWYHNTSTQELFYMPRTGENMSTATVMAPVQRQLITITGTANAPVHHIQFYGLEFAYVGWTDPTGNGLSSLGSDILYVPVAEAPVSVPWIGKYFPYEAIYTRYAQNLRFERNIFRHLGGEGLKMETGTQSTSVIGNVFYDISMVGLAMPCGQSYSVANDRCLNNTINNNYFYQIGRENHSAAAIFLGYTQGTTIQHNEIEDAPYNGISAGVGNTLTQYDQGGTTIQYNRIHNVMNQMSDGAGIYTLSAQSPSMLIDSNYVYDITRSAGASSNPIAAIYTDDGSDNITMSNNVLLNVTGTTVYWFNQNMHGPNLTYINNGGADPSTIANSGLESAYLGIKSYIGGGSPDTTPPPATPGPPPQARDSW